MPTRELALTALVASCVSSVVTLAVALLILPPVSRAAPDPQAVQPVVRAERFELVGADGNVRASLGAVANIVGLAIGDPSTSGSVLLAVGPDDTPLLRMQRLAGQSSITVSINPNDVAVVGLGDVFGPGISLAAGSTGEQTLRVQDGQQHPRVSLGVAADGASFVRLQDQAGHPVWQAP
jgi:hypothetical protein